MSERDYKAEVAKAVETAPNNPHVIAAILQAQALDRLTHEVARLAHSFEEFLIRTQTK